MALTLKYNFATSPTLVADTGPTLTCTRAGASSATVMDYDNVLRTVGVDEPRFTGGRRVENLCLRSEELDNASWVKTNVTVPSVDAIAAPDGSVTADYVQETAVTNTHYVYQLLTLSSSDTYSISVRVKKGTRRYGVFGSAWAVGKGAVIEFDFDTESIVYSGAATAGYSVNDAAITALEDGWYLVSGTFTTGENTFYLILGTADSVWSSGVAHDNTFLGDVAEGIYYWGAQVENVSGQDDPSPSEYQATTTAAVSKWYATKRRTNLLLQSNDFETTWTKGAGATLTAATEDGTRLEMPDAGATYINQSVACVNGTTYTFSIEHKLKSGSTDPEFRLGCVGIGLSALDGTESTLCTATSEWQRSSYTYTADEGDGNYLWMLDNTTVSPSSSSDIIIRNAQLEKGSTPTAYIPTTTTVASSAVDTAITTTGLLVEEARTNICLQSEDITTTWTNTRTTDAANSVVAPDGTTTADTILEDGTAASDHFIRQPSVSFDGSSAYTFSGYFKKANRDWVAFVAGGTAFPASALAYFDLTNGATGTLGGGSDSSSIEDVGNGWYRCIMTATSDVATTANIDVYAAEGDADVTYDGLSQDSIYQWGFQIEAGAFPTSYIPTTTVSVTRAADDVTTTDVSWLNAAAGTMYCKSRAHGFDNAGYRIWALNDGTANEAIEKYNVLNRSSVSRIRDGGSTLASFTGAIQASDTSFEAVMAWALNDAAAFTNGAQDGVDDTAVTIPTVTIFDIGQRTSGATNFLNGHIAEIRYYNSRLDNAALLNMSNGIFPASGKPGLGLTLGKLGM